MIFAKERVQVICDQLKKYSKVRRVELAQWQIKEGNFLRASDADAAEASWQAFDSRTMHWYGPDRHYWFRTEFTVPEEFDQKPLWLIFHTQIEEWDDGKNPQFLLFIDGAITQGLDMNHREVLVTECAQAGKTYTLDLQSYTGTLHSEFRLIGEAAVIDPQVQGLYYDIQVPLWALDRMNKDDKTRLDIETVLNNTINLLDFRVVPSSQFSASVDAARDYIKKALYEDMAGYSEVIATCIGHTHIDVAWWWTVEQTREKVARSFATVLKLMEEYPDYKFMSSQPQLYMFLKQRYPELYEKVKARVKEGRWEPEGGMWLEADCNLTSGESLVRQFIHGKRFFKDEFGVDNRVLWLPDVFGYSGALPQIMKKSGIDYFMTTKLSWNQFNKVPYDTLIWKGIDGSEVLTHFISTLGVGQPSNSFFTTYNGMLHPDAIQGGWERYQNKEINNDILVAFGYGDGGGGPTRVMLETSTRMDKGVKGIPKVRQEFSRRYFEELDERVRSSKRLPKWEGEFYFEYHRGTYTSMARNKRSNRKSELMLMDLELLSVLADTKGVSYPAQELDSMWKTVLLNQFHDILPGSSIKQVYEQTKIEYAQLAADAGELVKERLHALAGKGNEVVLFNTLGFERNDVVQLGEVDAAGIVDENGNVYPVQKTAEGAVAYVKGLPSKGYKSFKTCGSKVENPFVLSQNGIETPFYQVEFAPDGTICSIFDKDSGREILQSGKSGNLMRVYEDKPIYYDNWDIDIFYTEKFWDVTDIKSMEWIENGPVRATLEIKREYSASVISQKIHFYAQTRRIDFVTYVDWHENQHLLKVHFPVEIHTDEATFDVQFGNVTRKTHRNTSWDMARFESCGQKWADLSEGGYGVSLLNDCKYGHSVNEGEIALTLIKSGTEPNPETDQEEHFFTYSLYPHEGGWREGNTVFEAYKLNQPAYAVAGGSEKLDFSLVSADKEHVMIETVKHAEEGSDMILRIYDYQNRRGPVTVSVNGKIKAVKECDLLENELCDAEHTGNTFSFNIKPFEIKTFKVELA
ncbi:MAG TPA: alpha-mannosidase [Ruminiclostridium sp.]|nr:alpha-mannosidase [Ruminiclostridium sp.]